MQGKEKWRRGTDCTEPNGRRNGGESSGPAKVRELLAFFSGAGLALAFGVGVFSASTLRAFESRFRG